MIVLESERLLFREHRERDADAFCALEADVEVRRFVGGRPRTHAEALAKFRSSFLPPRPDRLRLWATQCKADGEYIGYSGLAPHFRPGGSAPGVGALGFYLARSRWGAGYAGEIGRVFICFGFQELKLARITAAVEQGNERSLRVIAKLGFAQESVEMIGARTLLHFALDRPPAH